MAQTFPPVNKIFDDLDKFRDFCRFEGYSGYPFDEKDLYDTQAPVWQAYQKYLIYKSKSRGRFNNYNNNTNTNNGTKRFYDRRGT
jgi:hypothetical protein